MNCEKAQFFLNTLQLIKLQHVQMTETYHPPNINDYKGEICAPKKGKRLLTIDALKAVYVALFHKPTHQHSRRVIAHVVTGDLLKRLQG